MFRAQEVEAGPHPPPPPPPPPPLPPGPPLHRPRAQPFPPLRHPPDPVGGGGRAPHDLPHPRGPDQHTPESRDGHPTIVRAFARIARRPRRTSERLFKVAARLPPVSRCTLSAMMKNRNSDTVMRLAMSHSSESRSRPSRMPASMPRNSTPIGSPISWPA